ncbi:hypothetical protein HY411_03200 [Candidatus Gottesmanbacteria bacterium]|nr:hypothetical protein [Candidatus Gottesmanbacteria bacterium]
MRFFRGLSRALRRINTAIFLHAAYVVGIGVVSVIGRAIGVRFLDETATKTNWKRPTGSDDSTRMF